MNVGSTIDVSKVIDKLNKLALKTLTDQGKTCVVVGFTGNYALYLHEGTGIYGPTGKPITPDKAKMLVFQNKAGDTIFAKSVKGVKGVKFLEGPARELNNNGTLSNIITQAASKKKSLMQGLLLAGLRIQREAMLKVPVDTGNLKNSAFTRIEPLPT